MQSIEQDLIYNSTNGRKKTVKHTQLGILIRKTGSKYLIETLNRLGHCTSYKTNVIETHFRETHIANRNEVYIPKGTISSNHVRFIYNKCDHNPERLSGVSMHCTNDIAVQRINEGYVDDSVDLPQVQEPVIKRRSLYPCYQHIFHQLSVSSF